MIIMSILWKRLNDTGKNWCHVYKASKKVGQQCLLFKFDEENIITEGRVINTSFEARVHNTSMKIGYLKVCIDKCLNPSSWSIHKTSEFKKVIDAEGYFVMWPSEFIRML